MFRVAALLAAQCFYSAQAGAEVPSRQVAQMIRPSLVQVQVDWEVYRRFWFDEASSRLGSGFIFDKDEEGQLWILTNAKLLGFDHISAHENVPRLGSYGISVKLFDGTEADILRGFEHEKRDAIMLVVKAEGLTYPPSKVEISAPEPGGQVYAFGYALDGIRYFTRGAVTRLDNLSGEIGTDANIDGGNSGGPLVNGKGRVVGLNIMGFVGPVPSGLALEVEPLISREVYVEFDISDPEEVEQHLNSRRSFRSP